MMLSRRKSKSSLSEEFRSRGSEFVDTLKRIGYPKALDLQGNAFDWLYEDPECEPFLNWFCRSLDESNVLSLNQMSVFQTLQATEQTLLDEDDLNLTLLNSHSRDNCSAMEDWPLDDLKHEVKRLRRLKILREASFKKLHAHSLMQRYQACILSNKVEACAKDLHVEVAQKLGAANTRHNLALLETRETIELLVCWHSDEGMETLSPPFLSKMGLSQYIRLEDSFMEALMEYIKVTMQQTEGNAAAAPLTETTREVLECSEEKSKKYLDQQLWQLEMAHICRLMDQFSIEAAAQSSTAALKWAEEALDSYISQCSSTVEHAFWRASGLREQLVALEEDVAQLKSERLLPLIRAKASNYRHPILLGDLNTETVRLEYLSLKQQEVASQLLKQGARQDVLTLALDVELQDHGETASLLEELEGDLKAQVSSLQERLAWMGNLCVTPELNPSLRIYDKDKTSMRLWELLEEPGTPMPLIKKYAFLNSRAAALMQNLHALQDHLCAPLLHLSYLTSDIDELKNLMYGSGINPRRPLELSNPTDRLFAVATELEEIVKFFKTNKSERCKSVENEVCVLQRDLYEYFFLDPRTLQKIVEEQEKR
ncbi:HAUS augmin-like complex subunit 3 [Ambystoma mexicanum]|uniref:HAUS augmin-like complex subunit 3 n=1 Tax=Ambystoma mexicanum TaxID=8296 RepID=UPI0037E86639